ncbi:hypothetical protein MOQ72_24635 [Saccharopolyspora sp. K220]|uniref:hypothetical protein n=1 Tax=Saccharopolyspora soli TaxID=2926618 RepID=UPI001F56248D|nr:hypothetical protein [Saccharopolyspora soli]MCI2420643.1 hypothetical protein [Saccharopolyspora soli]
MILALALLVGVVLVASGAPAVLDWMIDRRVDPQAVLVTWVVLVGATFSTVVVTLAIVLLPAHGPAPMLLQMAHHCWTALRHGYAPQLHELTALLLFVVVSAVAVQVGRGLLRYARQQRQLHARQLELLRITAKPEAGSFPTMWLPHPHPVAYSVAGAPAFIVATKGIRDHSGKPAQPLFLSTNAPTCADATTYWWDWPKPWRNPFPGSPWPAAPPASCALW